MKGKGKGTNRIQFLRGEVDKYTWMDVGSSYVPSDMLAAFLLGPHENMEKITTRRSEIYTRYAVMLAPLVERGLIRTTSVPQHCRTNYHMFYVLAADIEERSALIAHLRQAGILAIFHYVPLHSSPFARSVAKGLTEAGVRCALIEPGIDGALAAHSRGIDPVICARLEDLDLPPASTAAAGMFDVLEHLKDERAALRQVHKCIPCSDPAGGSF
jgi:hypothetical protein